MDFDVEQYLQLFVDESQEHLQAMNAALLELERNPEDYQEFVNEIFRAAHTIKGMAGTMGFTPIADLTHKIENVLQLVRDGKMPVTPNLVDILFEALDALETLISEAASGKEFSVDVSPIIEKLEKEAFRETGQRLEEVAGKPKREEKKEEGKGVDIQFNEYDIVVFREALQKGFRVFKILVVLDPETLLKAARVFMVFKRLEDSGAEIVKSEPSTEDLENENFDDRFKIVVVAKQSAEEIEKIITSISEIRQVVIEEVTPDVLTRVVSEEGKEGKPEKPAPPAETVEKPKEVTAKAPAPKAKTAHVRKVVSKTIRVDLGRLDAIMNLVGELVINQSRLARIGEMYKIKDLVEIIEQIGRITSDLQSVVMKARMIPVERLFNRFPRMIRDISKSLGKEINLIIEGAETELDKTVVDELGDPLVHLLRNAVDHGIEPPDEREKLGKPRAGTVRLAAKHEGNHVFIEVEDDGRGIDFEKIRKKVIERGLAPASEVEKMTETELLNFLFLPGFSTKFEVSELSGRGVGLDVVKKKIEELGGAIEVWTERGKGTKFTIKLPLTLAIIPALLVGVSDEIYAIPLGYVEEIISIEEPMIRYVRNQPTIIFRGSVLPLVDLGEILGVDGRGKREKTYVVVVRIRERRVGLRIDTLLGQQQIVIKSLGKLLKGIPGLAGATILGDGRVALILDMATLL